MRIKNKSKKGFALTEVLLAIAVIIIIGIAAYPLYVNSRNQAKTDRIVNDVVMLQKAMVTLFAPNNGYSNANNLISSDSIISKSGLEPDDLKGFLQSNSYWGLPDGSFIQTSGVQNNSGGSVKPGAGYTISVTHIPKEICVNVAMRLAPLFQDVGTVSGAGNIKGANGTTKVTLGQITPVCSNNTAANRALYFGGR